MNKIVKKSDSIRDEILNLSDDAIARLSIGNPWQYSSNTGSYEGKSRAGSDVDGFTVSDNEAKTEGQLRAELQKLSWEKYHDNPQVNTSVRGLTGRMAGSGFEMTSRILEIQEVIDEIHDDYRNRLWHFLPKFVSRSTLEGELFIILTLHKNGFIETDFVDPATVAGLNDDLGIIYHPNKPTMPLIFNIKTGGDDSKSIQVPSINLAFHPNLVTIAKADDDYSHTAIKFSRDDKGNVFTSLGGFKRFMIYWDKGLMTKRSAGHLRSVLSWLEIYENLKLYEVDHKKSSGAFVWHFSFDDPRLFREWLALSDEDKKKTSVGAKKTPGSSIVTPPGMSLTAVNPNLPKISEGDTDIMHQVTAGLNEPEDVSTGQAKGTFASVKASRGPLSDRNSDEVEYFRRFLLYDFWRGVFLLRSKVTDFKIEYPIHKAVKYVKKKAIKKDVMVPAYKLVDIIFPTSQIDDLEGSVKAHLGVKHGSLHDTLGIPHSRIAKRIGFGNYHSLRLEAETEDDMYPELMPEIDQESRQEINENGKSTKAPIVVPKNKTKAKDTKGSKIKKIVKKVKQ